MSGKRDQHAVAVIVSIAEHGVTSREKSICPTLACELQNTAGMQAR